MPSYSLPVIQVDMQCHLAHGLTLHGEIDCDVSPVRAYAGHDPDRVVIDGAPFVFRRRHA